MGATDLDYKINAEKLLEQVPEQYRDKLWEYAYMQGHSCGYQEVYNYMLDLVEIFK